MPATCWDRRRDGGSLGRQRSSPPGLVRVGAPAGITAWLVPRLPELLKRHPGLVADLVIGDQFGNMIDQRLDIAIIGQEPADNSLIVRTVGSFGRIAVASEAYLERYGAPSGPVDLANTPASSMTSDPTVRVGASVPRTRPVEVRGSRGRCAPTAALSCIRQPWTGWASPGYRSCRWPTICVPAGLYRLLPDYQPERFQVHMVYPSRRHLPPRVRVMIDFPRRSGAPTLRPLRERPRLG